MKTLIVAMLFALTSVSAYADVRIPVKSIETFAIMSSGKIILSSRMGAFDVPVSNCSIQSIERMEQPNIFFPRPYVKSDATVIVYDQANRKHSVRCNIDEVTESNRNILALL